MPIDQHQLLEMFGTALTTGHAALFVGAGLSRLLGYPGWPELLEGPRSEANIPEMPDLPLAAQYYVSAYADGRERLETHILSEMASVAANPGLEHGALSSLPVAEIWTTNYECLLESAMPDADVVMTDEDLRDRRQPWRRRIVKMHGSSRSDMTGWQVAPVITREDYERFEEKHPRIWASLVATFVTRSFLFLGFSFSDPNVEILLRLARTRLDVGRPEHFTILRRPTDVAERALHDHRVADLERSGIAVMQIDDFAELRPFLARLARRVRPPQLFVSGSEETVGTIKPICVRIGEELAEASDELKIASLAGRAGMDVSHAFGRRLRERGVYDAARISFFFRAKDDAPPPLEERVGTAFYTDLEQDALREAVIDQGRALLVIAGGSRTLAEARFAMAKGVPVIPVGASGGAAREIWDEMARDLGNLEFGGQGADPATFDRLRHPDFGEVAAAVVALVRQAMYLRST